MHESADIHFDGWVFRSKSGELLRGAARTRLQDLSRQILEELLAHPSEFVTREQLIARLWPTGVADFEMGLNAAMRKLRLALGDDAETPRFIETIPHKGYRFIGTIETASAPPATEPAASAPASRVAPPQAPVALAQRSKRVMAAMILIALMGLGSVLAVGVLFVNQVREKRSTAACRGRAVADRSQMVGTPRVNPAIDPRRNDPCYTKVERELYKE